MAIVHGLWTKPDGWSYTRAALAGPRCALPSRPERDGRRHPHLILGGDGGPRLTRLVATYADEYNRGSATPERVRSAYANVRHACAAIGRDPGTLVYSAMVGVLLGETERDVTDRVHALLAFTGASDDADAWLAERRRALDHGNPRPGLERIRAFETAGVQRIMLQDFLPLDLEMVALMGRLVRG